MRIHKHGGYVTKSQIENISRIFPSDKVKWNCCYDNDASGNGFDITTAYYLKVRNVKLLQGPTLETHIRPSI